MLEGSELLETIASGRFDSIMGKECFPNQPEKQKGSCK